MAGALAWLWSSMPDMTAAEWLQLVANVVTVVIGLAGLLVARRALAISRDAPLLPLVFQRLLDFSESACLVTNLYEERFQGFSTLDDSREHRARWLKAIEEAGQILEALTIVVPEVAPLARHWEQMPEHDYAGTESVAPASAVIRESAARAYEEWYSRLNGHLRDALVSLQKSEGRRSTPRGPSRIWAATLRGWRWLPEGGRRALDWTRTRITAPRRPPRIPPPKR
jgi:hypothetical protein